VFLGTHYQVIIKLFFSQLKAEEQLVEKYRLDNEDGLFD